MRIGFAGLGWIGRMRLESVVAAGVPVAAVADPSPEARAGAAEAAGGAEALDSYEALLDLGLDGVVLATPSALHADQTMSALDRGAAVFCQKPLGRTAGEVRAVVDAARRADRLLDVDFCYRRTRAMQQVRALVADGELGDVFAVELAFHNAYGPDKPWFYDRALAGGGCLMDLGVHLVDLGLWTLGFPAVDGAACRLLAGGKPWRAAGEQVEDYAEARLDLAGGGVVRVACSWRLPAGRDAVIEAAFYGTRGGARVRNVDGSFFDFTAERLDGRSSLPLVEPPDDWSGRAILAWVADLGAGHEFRSERAAEAVRVAEALDLLYAEAGCGSS